MKKTLVWNGKKSEDVGLKIVSLPPVKLSDERIEEKEVDGRDGSLTFKKGFQAETKQVICDYRGNNPYKIAVWLQKEGEVIFGNLPDRYYKARINNAIPIEQILYKQMSTFTAQFRCQPFGYLLDGKEPLILSNNSTLFNDKATYYSLPTITIIGSGACTFTINNRTFNIKEGFNGSITIDSYLQEVTSGNGELMEGDFPYLDYKDDKKNISGENIITWTGNITSCEIIPNWRAK
nr:phage tail protein [Clostridium saccharobutylicum]